MKYLNNISSRFHVRALNQRGATLPEYVLLTALLSTVLILPLTSLSGQMGQTFNQFSWALGSGGGSGSAITMNSHQMGQTDGGGTSTINPTGISCAKASCPTTGHPPLRR